jgi:hypothetical protein
VLGASEFAVSEEVRAVEEGLSEDETTATSREALGRDVKRRLLISRVRECVEEGSVDLYLTCPDLEEWFHQAREQVASNPQAALRLVLIALADEETPLLYREEGLDLVREVAHETFGYGTDSEASQNVAAIGRICESISEMGSTLEAPKGRHR